PAERRRGRRRWKSAAPAGAGSALTSSSRKSGVSSWIRQGREVCAVFGSRMDTSIVWRDSPHARWGVEPSLTGLYSERPTCHADVAALESGVVREQDLGDAIGLFERGEVPSVRKRDRSRASNECEVGFALRHARPIVVAVDQGDGDADPTVERSGGDHAPHVAKDLPRHARIPATPPNPTQLGEVVSWQPLPFDQTAPQDDAQDGLLLHPPDHG